MSGRRLAALTLLVGAVLAGCTSTTAGEPTTRGATSARSAATSAPPIAAPGAGPGASAADLLDGEYGLARLGAERVGTTRIAVSYPHGCAAALDVLRAGQWQLTPLGKPTSALPLYAALLQYGDHLALAYLQQVGQQCSGAITTDATLPLQVSGAATATGDAQALAVYCQVGPDPNGQSLHDLVALELAVYRSDAGTFLVLAQGPATKGVHQVRSTSDGPGVMVIALPAGASSVPVITALMQQLTGTGDGSGLERYITSAYTGDATLTVTSGKPFVATVTGSALRQQQGGGRLAITAGLRCDS